MSARDLFFVQSPPHGALHRKSAISQIAVLSAVIEGVNQLANWIENPRSGSLLERREYF